METRRRSTFAKQFPRKSNIEPLNNSIYIENLFFSATRYSIDHHKRSKLWRRPIHLCVRSRRWPRIWIGIRIECGNSTSSQRNQTTTNWTRRSWINRCVELQSRPIRKQIPLEPSTGPLCCWNGNFKRKFIFKLCDLYLRLFMITGREKIQIFPIHNFEFVKQMKNFQRKIAEKTNWN